MSTFHPVASSLANCNDTISMISMIDSSSILAVLIKTRTNVCHGITAHTFWGFQGEHQVNTENLQQRVETQCSGGFKISTFHPAASSLANFKLCWTFCSTSQFLVRAGVQSWYWYNYRRSLLRLDSSVMYMWYQRGIAVLGVWSIFALLLSTYWVLSAYFLPVFEISVFTY